jgi:EAL domain-containing protein (putative c-di-GMP-specific phosphodiesterase class I)/GGDEF domain-containing protein
LSRVVEAMDTLAVRVEALLSEQYTEAERLRRDAYADPVTGAGNRRAAERDLAQLVKQREEHGDGALFLVAVHGLRETIRARNYEGGDDLLHEAAARLRECIGDRAGHVARLGGATFAVAVPALARDAARGLAERLVELGRDPDLIALGATGVDVGVSACTGATAAPTLMDEAESALHVARHAGPGQWHLFEVAETPAGPDLYREAHWRDVLERTIDARSVVLVAQRVVDTARDATFHRELLARLRDDAGELVPAGIFVPMAARMGLSAALDQVIVGAAIAALNRVGDARLALNLSSASVEDVTFGDWIYRQFESDAGLAARLDFEVPEHLVERLPEAVISLAARLRAAGARFGVDHCGAGEVALRALGANAVDYLKVDGAFVSGADEDPAKQAYLRALVHLAHGMGASAVAEYVETAEELAVITDAGFDAVQGYHIGVLEPL